MNTRYKIKNFRCFDNEGAEFNIAPITLLTGANGAGKSSLTKSLMVLNSYLSENTLITGKDSLFDDSISITPSISIPLQFAYKDLKLGRFDSALNKTSNEEGVMTFEYDVESKSLGCKVSVSYEFKADKNDAMNNGWLSQIIIKNDKGDVVYHAEKEDNELHIRTMKLSWFKVRFQKAAIVSLLTKNLENINQDEMFGIDPILGITEETVIANKELAKYLRNIVETQFSDNEIRLFFDWYKENNEQPTKIEQSTEQIADLIETGVFHAENAFVKKLCSLCKQDAITEIQSIHFSPDFNIKEIVRIKKGIIEALSTSSFENFKDWYTAQENNELDKLHKPSFQTARLYYRDGNKKESNALSFKDIISLLYLADDDFRKRTTEDEIDTFVIHESKILNTFIKYLYEVALKELMKPDFSSSLNYIGSSQVLVQRLYSNQEGNNSFSDLLIKYFNVKKNYKGDYEKDSFLNKWIRSFGIGQSLTLKNSEGGFGIEAIIHNTVEDKGELLADNGYGITQLLSLLLNIEVAILTAETRRTWTKDNTYVPRLQREENGITMYLPRTLVIEEPENHLHPRLQSLLADMFYDAYINYNIHFIIETHSEYLLRKSQVIVANLNYESNEEAEKNSPFRAYYMPNGEKPYSLGYRKDGKFREDFGKGFYDEAANLMFEIL